MDSGNGWGDNNGNFNPTDIVAKVHGPKMSKADPMMAAKSNDSNHSSSDDFVDHAINKSDGCMVVDDLPIIDDTTQNTADLVVFKDENVFRDGKIHKNFFIVEKRSCNGKISVLYMYDEDKVNKLLSENVSVAVIMLFYVLISAHDVNQLQDVDEVDELLSENVSVAVITLFYVSISAHDVKQLQDVDEVDELLSENVSVAVITLFYILISAHDIDQLQNSPSTTKKGKVDVSVMI